MVVPPSPEASRPTASFTGLPPEIRDQIYQHLLVSPKPLRIEVAQTPHHLRPFSPPSTPTQTSLAPTPTTQIKPHPLSSQILRVSRLTHAEAQPLLYSHNTFDVSARSALHALTTTLSPPLFTQITSLTLDWDALQDFSFQLAKPTFVSLLSSLTTLSLANWRPRVLQSQSAFLWRDAKAYERSLCAAGLLIVERAPRLRLVAERRWVRTLGGRSRELMRRNLLRAEAEAAVHAIPGLAVAATAVAGAAGSSSGVEPASEMGSGPAAAAKKPEEQAATTRIKWRFLASESQMTDDEVVVDLQAEVAALSAKVGGLPDDEGPQQMALDPI